MDRELHKPSMTANIRHLAKAALIERLQWLLIISDLRNLPGCTHMCASVTRARHGPDWHHGCTADRCQAHTFPWQLYRPEAGDIIQSIRSFSSGIASSLTCGPGSVENSALDHHTLKDRLRCTCEKLEKKMMDHPLWRAQAADAAAGHDAGPWKQSLTSVRCLLFLSLLHDCGPGVYGVLNQPQPQDDARLADTLASLSFLRFSNFDLPEPACPAVSSLFVSAQDSLACMAHCPAPQDKMACLLQACRDIGEALAQQHAVEREAGSPASSPSSPAVPLDRHVSSTGADMFFPALLYTIVHAGPRCATLATDLRFIEEILPVVTGESLCNSDACISQNQAGSLGQAGQSGDAAHTRLRGMAGRDRHAGLHGEAGYFLTMFQSATVFLSSVEAHQVGMDEVEFTARRATARQRWSRASSLEHA